MNESGLLIEPFERVFLQYISTVKAGVSCVFQTQAACRIMTTVPETSRTPSNHWKQCRTFTFYIKYHCAVYRTIDNPTAAHYITLIYN